MLPESSQIQIQIFKIYLFEFPHSLDGQNIITAVPLFVPCLWEPWSPWCVWTYVPQPQFLCYFRSQTYHLLFTNLPLCSFVWHLIIYKQTSAPTDKYILKDKSAFEVTELNHLTALVAPTLALLFHRGLIFRPLWVRFLSEDQVLLFNADGGHPATMRQSSKIAGLAIPANHSGHRDRWNLVPPLLVPLYPVVLPLSLKATKSNRQSACPSEEQRGQPLSCYPSDLT